MEKAYYEVYRYDILAKWGFLKSFINWAQILLDAPKSNVNVVDIFFTYFFTVYISSQGFPFSHLTFNTYLKPLLSVIRQDYIIHRFL